MTTLHRHGAAPDTSTAGLLLSLASALPNPSSPLARRAQALAHRLSEGATTRAVRRQAADMLADLLDATDADLSVYDEEGLLAADFDA